MKQKQRADDTHDMVIDPVEALLDRIAPTVVPATFWLTPPDEPSRDQLTLHVRGKLISPSGAAADRFTYDHDLPRLMPGSGPVAITVKVPGVPAGNWSVDADVLRRPDIAIPAGSRSQRLKPTDIAAHPATWTWLRWHVATSVNDTATSRRGAFVQPPAVVLGSWPALVALGMVVALWLQSLVIDHDGLALSGALATSLLAIAAGAAGAKGWFMFLHRAEHRHEGWSVQGFVAALIATSSTVLLLRGLPVGEFLDATAPGLLIGMAIGRLGCFFTGCCAGLPTSSRWAVWSSNRSVGARRVPTQLLESAVAAVIGVAALVVTLGTGTHQGAVFIAAVSAYTIVRQGILRFREEARQSKRGPLLIAVFAAVVLLGDVIVSAL